MNNPNLFKEYQLRNVQPYKMREMLDQNAREYQSKVNQQSAQRKQNQDALDELNTNLALSRRAYLQKIQR